MSEPGDNLEPWRSCYRQLAPKLLLFARQWLPCPADAEDVVQTAFVRFWRHHPNAQPEHYSLLYAAVRTSALDLLRTNDRRARREQAFQIETPLQDAESLAPCFAPTDDAESLETALNRLPPEQRETVVLRIWGELTFAEIATALGESINTVAARYRYALDALRRTMKPHAHERVGI